MLEPSIWRRWGHCSHPGLSVIVAGALIITAFGLEIYNAVLFPPLNHADRTISAAFAFVVSLFIILFTNKKWFNTFRLFAVVTFVLTLTFGILSAMENEKERRNLSDAQLKNINNHSLAACILAFLALIPLTHVLWCCFFARKPGKVTPPRPVTLPRPVPPRSEYDVTVLVEGADSFNTQVVMSNGDDGGECFEVIQEFMKSDLIPGLQQQVGNSATFRFIQYSGFKQLAKSYRAPGSGVADLKSGLRHYNEEIPKTSLPGAKQQLERPYFQNLDGNSQLFLVLQDMNLKFAQNGRRQILLIICDEEWDVDGLQTPGGLPINTETIARTTARNFETYPIVIRPNELENPNEQFFKNNLASKTGNYKEVFKVQFDTQLKKAFREIVADLK